MKAVVFDFFGTLSINATRSERRTSAGRIAEALGASPDLYFERLGATFTERATGASGDLEATIRWLAELCECRPSDEQVRAACALRWDFEEMAVRNLRADAVPTLAALKDHGLKVGLLSDCTHELPEICPTLPIADLVDATVFSNEIQLRKPHPEMYGAVIAQLGVAAADCLYVGDGGSGELTGATQAGMTAYQLVAPDGTDAVIYDADTWSGPTLKANSVVVTLARVAGRLAGRVRRGVGRLAGGVRRGIGRLAVSGRGRRVRRVRGVRGGLAGRVRRSVGRLPVAGRLTAVRAGHRGDGQAMSVRAGGRIRRRGGDRGDAGAVVHRLRGVGRLVLGSVRRVGGVGHVRRVRRVRRVGAVGRVAVRALWGRRLGLSSMRCGRLGEAGCGMGVARGRHGGNGETAAGCCGNGGRDHCDCLAVTSEQRRQNG